MIRRCLHAFCLGCLFLSASLGARELSRFSCQRPEPYEEGSALNARIACELVDGAVLQPGETFSFNQRMRPGLDRFVLATSYSNGRVLRTSGGGICQVTAALYNAAVEAGLPVLERYSHSVYDSATAYVAAGKDCAVSRSNGADFRFSNSTAAPLSIGARALGGRVEVFLEGQPLDGKRRWIEAGEAIHQKHRVRTRENLSLKAGQRRLRQKGFDGLRVPRKLCMESPDGARDCVPMDEDSYMKVDEVWEEGPKEAEK